MKNKSTTQTKVLSDHRKIGRSFVPPMLQLGNIENVSFALQAIPELLWIAILNEHYGWKDGAELSLNLAREAAEATGINPEEFKKKLGKAPKEFFAATSAYKSLNANQQKSIVTKLKLSLTWEIYVDALSPLMSLYPEFPLGFIFDKAIIIPQDSDVEIIKSVISPLFDKNSKQAVSMYANAIYIAFATNKLMIVADDKKEMALANFPEIQNYPNTEESKVIAASIRASILSMIGMSDISKDWSNYFWNRGLEIEPCNEGVN